jgi:hypothetical protein
MRAKLTGWKHMTYVVVVLAAFALAAGARFKPV